MPSFNPTSGRGDSPSESIYSKETKNKRFGDRRQRHQLPERDAYDELSREKLEERKEERELLSLDGCVKSVIMDIYYGSHW